MKSIIAFQKLILSLLFLAWINTSLAQQTDAQNTEASSLPNTWKELGNVVGKSPFINNKTLLQQPLPYSIHDLIKIQRDALLKFQHIHPYFHSPKPSPYTVPKQGVKEGARVLKV